MSKYFFDHPNYSIFYPNAWYFTWMTRLSKIIESELEPKYKLTDFSRTFWFLILLSSLKRIQNYPNPIQTKKSLALCWTIQYPKDPNQTESIPEMSMPTLTINHRTSEKRKRLAHCSWYHRLWNLNWTIHLGSAKRHHFVASNSQVTVGWSCASQRVFIMSILNKESKEYPFIFLFIFSKLLFLDKKKTKF